MTGYQLTNYRNARYSKIIFINGKPSTANCWTATRQKKLINNSIHFFIKMWFFFCLYYVCKVVLFLFSFFIYIFLLVKLFLYVKHWWNVSYSFGFGSTLSIVCRFRHLSSKIGFFNIILHVYHESDCYNYA